MKKIILIIFLILSFYGCGNKTPEKPQLKEGINSGIKDEGYILSIVDGKNRYQSDKYIENEFDKYLPKIENVISFEYLEKSYVSIVLNGNETICENFNAYFKNENFKMMSNELTDFVNNENYVHHEGYRDNIYVGYDCKSKVINIRMEVK